MPILNDHGTQRTGFFSDLLKLFTFNRTNSSSITPLQRQNVPEFLAARQQQHEENVVAANIKYRMKPGANEYKHSIQPAIFFKPAQIIPQENIDILHRKTDLLVLLYSDEQKGDDLIDTLFPVISETRMIELLSQNQDAVYRLEMLLSHLDKLDEIVNLAQLPIEYLLTSNTKYFNCVLQKDLFSPRP